MPKLKKKSKKIKEPLKSIPVTSVPVPLIAPPPVPLSVIPFSPPPETPEAKQLRLMKNKNFRLLNYYYITTKESTIIKFFPNKAQKHYLLNRAKRNIILKSRQLGITTFACLDMLDDTLFTQNSNSLLIAQDEATMHHLFDKVFFAWNNSPFKPLFEINTERSNQLTVGFKDNPDGSSRSFSTIMVKQSGRSEMFNNVHISEYGKICAKYPDKVKEIKSGTFKSVPLMGKLTIESTAEGEDGDFATIFWDAWNRPLDQPLRPTDFKPFFYNWQWDTQEISKITQVDAQIPKEFYDYQMKHNEYVQSQLSKDPNNPRNVYLKLITDLELTYYFYKWLDSKDWNIHFQEYPTTPEEAFVSTGSKFFDQFIIRKLLENTKEPNIINNWHFFKPYISGHTYAIGADPSEGIGKDSCAAVIMDFTPIKPEVVATFACATVPPDIFAYELEQGGKYYNHPLIAVERNNHGHATITRLKDIYPNREIYQEVKEGYEDDKETLRYGWSTNLSTKPKMMYELRTAIQEDLLIIQSKPLLTELRTYSDKQLNNIKSTEEQTSHWDLLIALAICFQMKTKLHLSNQQIRIISPSRQPASNPYSAI